MEPVRRILVVDDEEAVRAFAGACIRYGLGEGYEVLYAAGGKEALEALEEKRPDLVLLDILMPEIDGYEVCRQMKSNPGLCNIPVVFLTAKGEDASVEAGLDLGAEGYVIKPFNAVTLAAQISEILADRDQP